MRLHTDGQELFSPEFDAIWKALESDSALTGCGVTDGGSNDMTVDVAAGQVIQDGSVVDVSAGQVTLAAADTFLRYDLIIVNDSGSLTDVTGSSEKIAPQIPSGAVLLAIVEVPANASGVANSNIFDARVLVEDGSLHAKDTVTIMADGDGDGTGTVDIGIDGTTHWRIDNSGDLVSQGGGLVLPTATDPSPTTEGSVVWDTDDDLLHVGTGGGTVEIGANTAPDDAQYVTLSTDANLSNERTLNNGTAISITDNGAGNSVDVALDTTASPSLTGTWDFTGGTITVPDPTASNHAADKEYVDSVANGLDWKDSVRAATESNIDLTSSSDPNPVDGVTLTDGDRILLKSQSTASENGIYVATTATDPTTWSRAADADEDSEVTGGMTVWVEEGTANADQAYVLTTDDPITVGSTAQSFSAFSTSALTAGDGLTKSGNTLNVGGGTGISANANDVAVDQSFSPTWTGTHTFDTRTVMDGINLRSSDSIQDAGTDALQFDGSQNVTIANGSFTASGASTLTGDVTLQQPTNDYIIEGVSNELTFRNSATGSGTVFSLVTQDQDGSDSVTTQLFGVGNGNSTDREALQIQASSDGTNITEYVIKSFESDAGSHHPIKIESGGNTDQFVVRTDGSLDGTFPNTTSGTNLVVATNDGSSQEIFRASSTRRHKTDIEVITDRIDPRDVLDIHPKRWAMRRDGSLGAGFIAEDIASLGIEEGMAYVDDDGERKLMGYKAGMMVIDAAQHIVLQDHDDRLSRIEDELGIGA